MNNRPDFSQHELRNFTSNYSCEWVYGWTVHINRHYKQRYNKLVTLIEKR